MAYEEPEFDVVAEHEIFEVRRYRPFLIVEVGMPLDFEEAGKRAFGILFDYISGANRTATQIEMTVPVTQASKNGEKIEMMTPVLQRSGTRADLRYLLSVRADDPYRDALAPGTFRKP